MKTYLIILFSCLSISAQAQNFGSTEDVYRSPIRKVLNYFSLSVSTGYNSTQYKQDLGGFYLLQSPSDQLIAVDTIGFDDNSLTASNWLNDPMSAQRPDSLLSPFDIPKAALHNPVLNDRLNQGYKVYDADSLGIGFKGRGWSIPLNIGLRFNYKRFRVGGGFTMEYHRLKTMTPTAFNLGIRNYTPNFKSSFFSSYYAMIGYRFYDFWDYSFAGELQLGQYNMGKHFNSNAITQSTLVNFGISIEKNLSEYFRIFVKPSYDFKSYKINIDNLNRSIATSNRSFNFNFGVSITFPEIPRSPMKSDHIQLKHVITHPKNGRRVEVRGQPIHKIQNPKIGQLYRRLWRYKAKNKNKKNPY